MIENLLIKLIIAIPIYSFVVIVVGFWLGHRFTLKAFAHVQPSTKDMAKMNNSFSASVEPDPYEEAMKESPFKPTQEEESNIAKLFKKAKIPKEIYKSYMNRGIDPRKFLGFDIPYNEQNVETELEKESV